ncbi:hypothetical protein Areg01_22490 [Actinoplanes regularis]|nr:hypothetical protein Areg01_22490 [Actinoplanes regularis]
MLAARLLCPDESHPPPCPAPSDFSVMDDESGRIVLLVLLWTIGDSAAEAAGKIQAYVGPADGQRGARCRGNVRHRRRAVPYRAQPALTPATSAAGGLNSPPK